jgi:hypothetical protein
MNKTTVGAIRRFSILIALFFFPALLAAQGVIIKENIQINPKARIINKAALSSDIPCFEGSIVQGKENQSIHVLRALAELMVQDRLLQLTLSR